MDLDMEKLLWTDDGKPNMAYVSVDDCLIRSVVGADKNGPRTIVLEYGSEKVDAPAGARRMTGDPQKDMQLMMEVMGGMRPPG